MTRRDSSIVAGHDAVLYGSYDQGLTGARLRFELEQHVISQEM